MVMANCLWSQTTVSRQLWGNAILGFPQNKHLYLEVDLEPKTQISGGERWRNIDVTPLLEYYPNSWLDLTAEVTFGYTVQTTDLRSLEFTPRIGIRFHLFKNVWDQAAISERVPLSRLQLATLFRLEYRNINYNLDLASEHESRARLRIESKIAINHNKLANDKTFYLFTDGEYFYPINRKISERYASKIRIRFGPGYRVNRVFHFELLLIFDDAQNTLEDANPTDTWALDLRAKIIF
jgi:hypothetical protein